MKSELFKFKIRCAYIFGYSILNSKKNDYLIYLESLNVHFVSFI